MRIFIIATVLILTACAKPSTQQVADSSGFTHKMIQAGKFNLASYQKHASNAQSNSINVYIEGDGYAWINKHYLSVDPSPRSATVMQLAALDPAPNVVYLARPCQYSALDLATVCEDKYWSIARYSEDVVQSIDSALAQLKIQYQAEKINLIGFSGGGALAVLVSARRKDIASIRTVAGNLDLQAMDKYHHTTPLTESLDPLLVAKNIAHIPQLHFVGSKDHIVPKTIALNFVKVANLNSNSVVIVSAGHHKGWREQWVKLLELE